MTVHSCCCIGVFVLSGLLRTQKRIQNPFKKLWKLRKEKKRVSLLSLAFGRRPRTVCFLSSCTLAAWPTSQLTVINVNNI
jgi:hypothetical protein